VLQIETHAIKIILFFLKECHDVKIRLVFIPYTKVSMKYTASIKAHLLCVHPFKK